MKQNRIFLLTEEENQKVVNIVANLQNCWVENKGDKPDLLFTDERDWVVVMRCLIDAHILSTAPKRPPLGDFIYWLCSNGLDQLRVPVPHISTLSRTYTGKFDQAENYTRRWNLMTQYLQRELDKRNDCSTPATK